MKIQELQVPAATIPAKILRGALLLISINNIPLDSDLKLIALGPSEPKSGHLQRCSVERVRGGTHGERPVDVRYPGEGSRCRQNGNPRREGVRAEVPPESEPGLGSPDVLREIR